MHAASSFVLLPAVGTLPRRIIVGAAGARPRGLPVRHGMMRLGRAAGRKARLSVCRREALFFRARRRHCHGRTLAGFGVTLTGLAASMQNDVLPRPIGNPCEKVGLVVDGPFLFQASKVLDFEVDYRRLLRVVAGDAVLVRAVYATTIIIPDFRTKLSGLLKLLDSIGYDVVVRPAREVDGSGHRRRIVGSISVDVALESLDLATEVDHLVLVAGSGDYVPLLRRFRGHRARMTLVSTPLPKLEHFSGDILVEAKEFIDLRDLQARITRGSAAFRAI